MTADEPVEVSIHVAATPETVFPYFTDPERYVRWMGSAATLEPVPGGQYRVRMRDGVEAAGEFTEVDPPHRVVFTWGWAHDDAIPPGSTRVEVTLWPEAGGTWVVLRHCDLPGDAQREHHRSGWELYLGRLRTAAGGAGHAPSVGGDAG